MTEEEAAMVVPGDELWAVWWTSPRSPVAHFVRHHVARSVVHHHPLWDGLWPCAIDVIDDDGIQQVLPIDNLYRDRSEAERRVMVEVMSGRP
jgi:hypothetical protein